MNELHGSGTASSVGGAQGVGLSTWGPSPPSLWGILIGVFAGIALGGLFGQTLWHARGGPGQRQARLEAELRRVESFLQSTVPTDAARRQQAEAYRRHITTELAQLQSQAQAPAHMWDWLLRLAAQGVYLCGQIYIRLLTLVVLPLVIFSLITGAASLGQTARLGQVALWAFSYYLLTSALAVLLGLVLVQTLRPGLGQMPLWTASVPPVVSGKPSFEEAMTEVLVGRPDRSGSGLIPSNLFAAAAEK